MKAKVLLVSILAAAASTPGTGRSTPPAPPPKGGASGALVEKVEVRLAQFDVVVRDAAGRAVPGLAASDFTVEEGGAPLEIVAVDEWGAPAAPAAAAPEAAVAPSPAPQPSPSEAEPTTPKTEGRSILLLFDGLNTGSAQRVHLAKRAAREFVREHLGPKDLAAVYVADMALRAMSGFSSDREEIARAIDRVAWLPPSTYEDDIAASVLAFRNRTRMDEPASRLTRGAALQSQILDWQREHLYETLLTIGDVFPGLPGKRVLVLLSSGFPITTPGEFTSATGGFTPRLRELIRSLAKASVTTFSIDLGDEMSLGDASKGVDWRTAAYQIGLDDSALADLGLDHDLAAGSGGERRQFLGVLAGETGGQLLTSSDFRRSFSVIQEETTHFYRISCKVPQGKAGSAYRKTTIRVRGEGLRVSARRGRYGDIVPGADGRFDPAQKSVVEDLSRFRPISVRGTAAVLPPSGGFSGIPVVVVAEALGPIAFPSDGEGGIALDVDFSVVARAGAEVVRRLSRSLDGRVRAAGAGPVRNGFRVEARLDLPPGHYDLQATLRINEPPQFGSWSVPLTVPAASGGPGSIAIVGVFLTERGEAPPLLLKAEVPAGTPDPVQIDPEVRILPSTHPDLAPAEALALFWVRGLDVPEGSDPDAEIRFRVLDAGGAEREVAGRLLQFRADGAGGQRGILSVDLAPLAAGVYTLALELADRRAGGAPAVSRTRFQVRGGEEPAPAAATSASPAPPGSPGTPGPPVRRD